MAEDKFLPIEQAAASSGELGEKLAIRMMLAGIISYQAATAADENLPAAALVEEMKRIVATVIEAMDLQVKSASEGKDPLLVEEEIRRAALDYVEKTFAFVNV